MALACLCVAAPIVATKQILDTAPVLPTLLIQIAASTIVLWLIGWRTGRLPGRAAWRYGWPGLLQPALAYILIFQGLELIPASVEGLLAASEAALVAMLAWPLIGERPTVRVIASIIVGTTGVLLITGSSIGNNAVPLSGVFWVLGGIALAALDTVYSRRLVVHTHPLTMTIAGHCMALTLVALVIPFLGAQNWQPLLPPPALTTIAISGIVLHGAATVLFNHALTSLPAAFAAALFPLISLLTALGGLVFLGETLSVAQAAGGALVIGSALLVVWCIERRESRAFDLPA